MSMFQSPVYKNTKPGGSGRIRRKKIKTPSACVRCQENWRSRHHHRLFILVLLLLRTVAGSACHVPLEQVAHARARGGTRVAGHDGPRVQRDSASVYTPEPHARHTVREMPTSSPRSACKPARSGHLLLSSASP